MKRKRTTGTNKSDLEKLAKGMFERYSLEKTGKTLNWDYLGPKRKLVWMREAVFFLDYLVEQVSTHLGQPPKPDASNTSFAMGYNQGLANERQSLYSFFEFLDTKFEEQLKEFEYNNKD